MPRRTSRPPPADAPSPPTADPLDDVVADADALWTAARQTSGEYLVLLDRAGIIRWLNRVDDGFRVEDVVGRSMESFIVSHDTGGARVREGLHEVFERGMLRSFETAVRRLDGGHNYFVVRLGPVVRGGRVVAALACCENIRPLRTSEQTLRRLIEIQERERQLISYEIHDGLAQYLAGAIMHLEAHLHAQEGREPRELVEGVRLLRAAVDESRRLLSGLRPPALDELGIVEAIESLVADARIEIPDVEFSHALPEGRLPAALETTIFRIVQESLSNARKHASARRVRVRIERVGQLVSVSIRDDGRGFDTTAVPEQRFGLEGIRQRSRLAGGEARITSAPGRGTTVEVDLPISPGPPA